MLLNLIVIPKLAKNSSKRYVYGFEELENNLHPAMQRKVFEYFHRITPFTTMCAEANCVSLK